MHCEVLFFTAPWCDPCHQAAPIFSEVTRELGIAASIVDADLTPDVAARFGVESLPTVVVLCEGEVRDSLAGTRPKAELRSFLRRSSGAVHPPDGPGVAD